ncbi:NADP-dependent phosphogluconate dehydrogenase [Cypionkella psychrotolerans]|uniref:NADP-dependent phosphogluconate dehydrogenase n=1 Tax=Cypionkella psychrotolerans TaxID=1678131 RepID=UPI0006B52F22|nr:NADP-dependent phosphogluconate dehydrogenase [Cypionkella psychrotolerans]
MASQSAVPSRADIGVIGLGVMGSNLALNIEDHGFRVALWNLTHASVTRLIEDSDANRQFVGTRTLEEFAAVLDRPRRILLMIKAGAPVNEMLEKLAPLLAPDDVIVDGGNSLFTDTQRREVFLRASGVRFIGMGVSGGEEGARNGPSLMPGGDRTAYNHLRPILESIAAKTDSGPCVTYVGPDGAGHFVKTVHNGIEYGVMQLIAEAYDLLRRGLGLSAAQTSAIFANWNGGPLASYLIEIAAQVLSVRDPETGNPLVEMILDQAGQKGTGKWTAQAALDLGVPVPTIAAAIDARVLSSMKAERVHASQLLVSDATARMAGDTDELARSIRDALGAAIACTYAQGFALLRAASAEYDWDVDMREIARIWKGGCIIRARLLDPIIQAFGRAPDLANLLLDADFRPEVLAGEAALRLTIGTAVEHGIPVPGLSATLGYFDSYRSAVLPQNLTQAQRDLFGAHTYQRIDRPDAGFVHTDWPGLIASAATGGKS